MEESINQLARPRAEAGRVSPVFWGTVIALAVLANLIASDPSTRLRMLRALLLVLALAEALLGFVPQAFYPRRACEREGRPYDPAYHGVVQDFGFYNLAFASLFIFAALDPGRSGAVIAVAIGLYALHGLTHVLRSFGIYYGGGTSLPTRPPALELDQGLMLLAGAAALALFRP
jgi:hypothetical protein